MVMYNVNEEDFDKVTKEGFWIADFATVHCGPCKMLDMVLEQIIFDNPVVNLAKCDIEKSPAYVDRFNVTGTPTLLFINDGEIIDRMTGARGREELEEEIRKCMYGE